MKFSPFSLLLLLQTKPNLVFVLLLHESPGGNERTGVLLRRANPEAIFFREESLVEQTASVVCDVERVLFHFVVKFPTLIESGVLIRLVELHNESTIVVSRATCGNALTRIPSVVILSDIKLQRSTRDKLHVILFVQYWHANGGSLRGLVFTHFGDYRVFFKANIHKCVFLN